MLRSRCHLQLLILAGAVALLAGCAAGPGAGDSLSASSPSRGVPAPNATAGGSSQGATPANRLLAFSLTVNDSGVIDATRGLYAILINAFSDPIDVTQNDKFTDFILWDGNNLTWYHRQTSPQNNSFVFVPSANLNQALTISPDRRTLTVTFNPADPSNVLNQFVVTDQFTVQAMTTDRLNNAILGRVLDTLGPGPSLDQNALHTITVNKFLGAVSPLPADYPTDPLDDWVTEPDLGTDFPYVNFDIERFEVISQ